MKEAIIGGILNKSNATPFTIDNIAFFKNQMIDIYVRKDINLHEGHPNGSTVYFSYKMIAYIGKNIKTINTDVIFDEIYYYQQCPTIDINSWIWQFDWLEFKLTKN